MWHYKIHFHFDGYFGRILKALLVILFFSWLSFSFLFGDIQDSIGLVSFFSALIFLTSLVVGLLSEKLFWTGLPLVLISIPNAINDFFPSVPMAAEEGAPLFSFFTHIDLYLFLGLVRHGGAGRGAISTANLFFIVFVSLSSFFLFLFASMGGWFKEVLVGGFQFRYMLLMLALFLYCRPFRYESEIFASSVVALVLVVFESFAFTALAGHERLTSGNYGVNALGHLMAAAAALVIVRCGVAVKHFGMFLIFLLFILAVYLSGTRFSIIAFLFGACFAFYLRKEGNLLWLFLVFGLLVVLISIFLFFFPAGKSLMSGMAIVLADVSDPELIPVTPESSSIVTRLILWLGSLNMLADNLWFGAGPGIWAHLKSFYEIPFEGVLDPHQDLLSYLVSYGLIVGFSFYFFVFFAPVFYVRRYRGSPSFVWGWFAFLMVFLMAGVSNAVTWKHQVGAIVYFCSFMVLFWGQSGRLESESSA